MFQIWWLFFMFQIWWLFFVFLFLRVEKTIRVGE